MVGIAISEGHLEANTEEDENTNLVINVSVSTNTFKTNSVVMTKCGRRFPGLQLCILQLRDMKL